MKKKLIRLTENDLHRIIENSVRRVLKEKEEYVQGNLFGDDSEYSEPKGALEKREANKIKQKEANKKRREAAKERKYKKENDAKNEFTRAHSMFNESVVVENSSSKRKYINRIYKDKGVNMYLHHSFKDNDWSNLNKMFDMIGQVPGVVDLDVRVENGGYRENDGAKWKEYQISIEVESGDVINGIVNCHFCGSMQDPTDRYDITLQMW